VRERKTPCVRVQRVDRWAPGSAQHEFAKHALIFPTDPDEQRGERVKKLVQLGTWASM
jgi:hypothetical protein